MSDMYCPDCGEPLEPGVTQGGVEIDPLDQHPCTADTIWHFRNWLENRIETDFLALCATPRARFAAWLIEHGR